MKIARWIIVIGLNVVLTATLSSILRETFAQTKTPASSPQSPLAPRAKVTNPHGPLSIPCQNCHSYTSWKPIRSIPEFDHDQTRYPLRGMHRDVSCNRCHTSLRFRNSSTRCADCHADIHRRQFGANCESCHTVKGWQMSIKEIQNHQNRFPLVGAHAMVDCVGCHKGAAVGQFRGLSTACYSCHQQDFKTPVFDHVSTGFPTTCQDCHTMNTWFGAKFDHLKYTGFALTGMHSTLDCTACHVNNKFKGTPAACYNCHQDAFLSAQNPNHVQAGLPHDCGICHTTVNWLNAKFDHSAYTSFPLTGMHSTVACNQCHVNGRYAGTPKDCYSCHKTDFTSALKPNHVASGFPTDCTVCHTIKGWIPSSFDHSKTAFPLTGAHMATTCSQCHVNNVFKGTPTDCYSCHQASFMATTNPGHLQAGLPHNCTICHTTVSWQRAKFDHASYTNYPLTGMHASLACNQCHINGQYNGTPTACYSCHKNDFSGAKSPNHLASGFPTDCSICHTTKGWTPSSFDHSKTIFPLTGAHTTVNCASCHVNNNYTTVATDCYSCHKSNFTGTTNPNHVSAGFPTNCTLCHNTTSWAGATFDHSKTAFPLTGAHVSVSCNNCHVNNVFAGTPKDCYSCHKTQYNSTTNPNHLSAGFPTTCNTCHTTTTWAGATFNHTWFNTQHGGAKGVCTTCHTNSANYAVFTCTNCHSKSATDPRHSGVSGYVYNSVNCYACHKNVGSGGGM